MVSPIRVIAALRGTCSSPVRPRGWTSTWHDSDRSPEVAQRRLGEVLLPRSLVLRQSLETAVHLMRLLRHHWVAGYGSSRMTSQPTSALVSQELVVVTRMRTSASAASVKSSMSSNEHGANGVTPLRRNSDCHE